MNTSFCRVQSTITWLLTHSHDTSPSSAAAVFGRHCSLIHMIPAPPQRSAVCRGHSLIHMIPAPHQRLPCFVRHCSFFHTIPASHQRLPCVEDSALSLIQGDMEPLLQSLTHSPVVKRPPPQSGSESYYETARKSEESPDAPAQKSARRRLVTWCPCAEKRAKAGSHLMPRRAPYQPSSFAGLLRQLFTPLRSGVQLGQGSATRGSRAACGSRAPLLWLPAVLTK